ncbi:Na+-transporting NADH:ubiquinone oxidoreductase, subunit NqrB [Leptolyngbya sp. 'hensonii']|nr:Na+-transporting NADH:ubiquinone oxidoreductase, subunit NqrB [Leptolyngbya sp. 'hensonii']
MMLKDARDYQILSLSLFLFLGIATRDWTLRPDLIGVILATCLLTQWLTVQISTFGLRWWTQYFWGTRGGSESSGGVEGNSQETPQGLPHASMPSLRSALITGLGLCLLLRADHWTTVAIAAALAILSKFLFRIQGKHFFNPANFGMITVLLLTSDAWVSPGQWGEEWWYGLLFAGLGGMVLQRVGRWDTTAAFLGAYAILEAGRNFWLGWTWDVYLHKLMSGSLLLFALFMVTDPRSIPNARTARIIWALCIAGLTFVLRNQFYVSTAILWALFALSPLTLLLDRLWAAPQFSWGTSPKKHPIDTELSTV